MTKPNLETILKCKLGQEDFCKHDTEGNFYCTLYFPEERLGKFKCNLLTYIKEFKLLNKNEVPYRCYYWGCGKWETKNI